MDLSAIEPSPYWYEVKNPATGKPIGLSLLICDPTDPDYEAVESAHNKVFTSAARDGVEVKEDEIEDMTRSKFAARIKEFKWGKGADGKPASWNGKTPDYSHATAKDMLTRDWLYRQVMQACSKEALFFQGQNTGSAEKSKDTQPTE
ncbi:hypothetical protein FF098_014835 [Parvularcula flava]|uniref:Uncharacterized protein n=1 Tax=Aquisalinus luteolus TaxID=1566827 RepID=A0A8J3A3C4_9PROT|nr:hypothetical protein [Aquisalinus luteolus]NHK29194.1 hypothetical protein [Aquisalinus luteolus]GGI00015.1 hypothetical protein GCM10011355_27310 [Aquisalinus luteolus]